MDDKIIAALWPSNIGQTPKVQEKPAVGVPETAKPEQSAFASMVKAQETVTVTADSAASALRQVGHIAATQGTDTLINLQLMNNGTTESVTVSADAQSAAAALYGKWKNEG